MQGLDFWATDDWTDSRLPLDEWTSTFVLSEWTREVMRDEVLFAAVESALRRAQPALLQAATL